MSPGALDALLPAGVEPDASPALRRRARKLARQRRREQLARGLEAAVAASQARPRPLSSAIPIRRAEVRAARTVMLALASAICAGDGLRPAGLILTRHLLTDGRSPLYAPAGPGELRDAVAEAMVALSDGRPHSP
jgi:hypothetical protein